MTIRVTLQDVIEGMEWQSDDTSSYLNTSTGEVVTVAAEHMAAAEEGREDESLADWERDAIAVAREVVESSDYLRLPDRFEINEYRMMQRFADSCRKEEVRMQIDQALHGSGAFRCFKDTVSRLGLDRRWYAFRDIAYQKVALDWCRVHGIEIEKTADRSGADA